MKSILDPSFRYTSSLNTDIAKTFARIRRIQRQSAVAAALRDAERSEKIVAIQRPVRTESKVG